MNPRTFRTETPLQALIVEQALMLAKQLETTADAAPDGQVLARVEALAVPAARELARRAVEAGLVADWLHDGPAVGAGFAAAGGDIEFQTDGTMVNTWEGWREMRLGVYARRRRGRPATAAEWDTRRLPPPHARVLFAGIETA